MWALAELGEKAWSTRHHSLADPAQDKTPNENHSCTQITKNRHGRAQNMEIGQENRAPSTEGVVVAAAPSDWGGSCCLPNAACCMALYAASICSWSTSHGFPNRLCCICSGTIVWDLVQRLREIVALKCCSRCSGRPVFWGWGLGLTQVPCSGPEASVPCGRGPRLWDHSQQT